jgi:hypothetical protein
MLRACASVNEASDAAEGGPRCVLWRLSVVPFEGFLAQVML